MSTITVKRGDTIPFNGVVTIRDLNNLDISASTDFSAWSISSQLRAGPKLDALLAAEASLAFVGSTNEFVGEVSAADSAALPDTVYLDLRFKDGDGKVMSSRTIKINVEDAVSEAP